MNDDLAFSSLFGSDTIKNFDKEQALIFAKIFAFIVFVNNIQKGRIPLHLYNNFKFQWLITLKDVESDPQFTNIVYKYKFENVWNKFNTISLSDYVIISKLIPQRQMEKESNHNEYEEIFTIYRAVSAHNQQIKGLSSVNREIPHSDYVNYDTNFGEITVKIFEIIRYAYSIHASKKLVCDLIVKMVTKIMTHDSAKWECKIELFKDDKHACDPKKGSKYFHAYCSYEEKIVCISIYSTLQ
jgi:hypothetical protein